MIDQGVIVLWRKIKQDKGSRSDEWWWWWDRKVAKMVNRGLSNEVTSGPRPKGSKGASPGDIWVGRRTFQADKTACAKDLRQVPTWPMGSIFSFTLSIAQ